MEVPFMRGYALALVQACHSAAPRPWAACRRDPDQERPCRQRKALAGIRHDKTRDANDGFDGGWAWPTRAWCRSLEEFVKVLGDKPNQFEKQVEGKFGPEQWLDFRPTTPITEAGLRNKHQCRHPLSG